MRLMLADNPKLAAKAHVFVDGVDVSTRCYGADEEKGEAYCYTHDATTGLTKVNHTLDCKASHQTRCTLGELNGCDFAREILRGEIKIEIPEAA